MTGTTEIVYNTSYEMLFEEETKPGLEGFEKGQVSELAPRRRIDGVSYLLRARRGGRDEKSLLHACLFYDILHYKFRHRAAADIAVADKKYFYHCCITSHFLVFLGISGFVSPCKFLLFGITLFIFA